MRENMEERETGERQNAQVWDRETVPRVMKILSSRLPQKDLVSLLLVSPWLHRTLVSYSSLWPVLDFHEMNNAGDRLVAAVSLSRYHHVKQINLEFAQDIEDRHLELIRNKCMDSLQNLEYLNLNGCQKISDKGVEAITSTSPTLKVFSIYWNVRVTDIGISHLVKNCKLIVDLNLSGCKNITDRSMQLVADNYQELESLNITRCIKVTDGGLQQILLKCSALRCLNLYALSSTEMCKLCIRMQRASLGAMQRFLYSDLEISNYETTPVLADVKLSFTDEAYKRMQSLVHLRFLDLCGAQNLSDQGLFCIAKCKNLRSLNLTWCVRVTDVGVIAIAEGCTSLEFLSLFGIVGVTDNCLEALSRFCSNTITTLDVNGCIGIKRRSREELLQLFPYVTCFKVHS